MDKARVVITPEQFAQVSRLNLAVHNPQRQHRSDGWARWRGYCATCEQGTPWGGQADADEWVLDHLQDFPPPPDCNCFPEVAGRLEYSPLDCPLHKETAK